MSISKSNICLICGLDIPLLGMSNHVPTHGLTYATYIKRFLLKKCSICGNPVRPPRKFCSRKCFSKYFSGKAVIRTSKKYKDITEEEKREIIKVYTKKPITLKEMSQKFNISVDVLKTLLKKEGIERYSSLKFVSLRYQEKINNFLQSHDLIGDYLKVGGSLHNLSKKYKIQRKILKNILIKRGVTLKDPHKCLEEVNDLRRKRGIHGHRFGKTPPVGAGKSHWFLYDGIKYQGSWEFKLGLWLKYHQIPFLCHSGVRQFSYTMDNVVVRTYCPDFYIPKDDYFIDVKGYFSDSDKQKMIKVSETYPDVDFRIYDKNKLKEMGVFSIDKLLGIRIEDYVLDYKEGDIIIDRFLSSISPIELAKKKLIERKNLSTIAQEYDIPYFLMCRAYYRVVPKEGSVEFYQYILNNFFNPSHLQHLCEQSPYALAKEINNGLSWKRNLEVIKKLKEGQLVSCL